MRVVALVLIISSICFSQKKTNNYSLGSLGYACGINSNTTTQTKMSDCSGITTVARMSDFLFTSIESDPTNLAFTYYGEEQFAQILFVDEGILFSRIKLHTRNFDYGMFPSYGTFTMTKHSPNSNYVTLTAGATPCPSPLTLNMYFSDAYNVVGTVPAGGIYTSVIVTR